MYATDFVFDGIRLSDYGYIICEFDASSGARTASIGSNLTFTKVSMRNGRKHSLVDSRYDECITFSFDICKDPDLHDPEDMEISGTEFRELAKWLNRIDFKKFYVIDNDSDFWVYYNGSFNIEKISIASKLYGLRLTFESDSPFGYGDRVVNTFDFSGNSEEYTVFIETDDAASFYPDLEIECLESGDISITNVTEESTTTIKNCTVGEIISISGFARTIITDHMNHDICDDFNYEFFRMRTVFGDNSNVITSPNKCKLIISYLPTIKDIPQ